MTEQHGEHGSVHHMMGRLQDLFGGLFGRATASQVTTASAFVENAALGDMYEIQAARLAQRRSSLPALKEFAQTLVADHTTSTHHLQAALEMNETKGVKKPPAELDGRRRKMIENLEAAPTDRFDQMYLEQQLMAHKETFTLMEKYYRDGDNAQLRSCAAGAAPVVFRHLQRAKALKSKLPS